MNQFPKDSAFKQAEEVQARIEQERRAAKIDVELVRPSRNDEMKRVREIVSDLRREFDYLGMRKNASDMGQHRIIQDLLEDLEREIS